ncbi:APA family basic amino acid/polyamine antiporter [Streptosporangium becharense]|uniref:APA family basic amino acid/polyamine antiporter n=1 Tax=Streptosporangium becharense TaxID=1816182 RepID=A0A7W9MIU9_9ACTN|nr:amino acid permease [Streptosporangium becharense]MBB2911797.1 APA family basic amino acid/polyamine antiporter [Streptosporangium becharense]MBB5822385.1 APA family basic amino acid/polyamine antiporter [Streptosporangium becharense]
MGFLRVKSVEQSILDTEAPEHRLRKDLSATDLTVFGIGVIVGTGIFVLTGRVARETAGPAVALSFVIAGIVCALAALCYAEFASTVPVAGSAYTFAFATLGEFPAWIIGWDLMLEMMLGAAVVAVGWSGYLTSLLTSLGITLPATIAGEGATFNLPAALIVLLLTAVLVLGIKLSSRVNLIIVTIKVAVVLLVIVAGLFFVNGANYSPFIPPSTPTPAVEGLAAPLIQVLFGVTPVAYGVLGIFSAAAIVFFAYIGFDVVATAAEETRNPQRDLPIGILASLGVCTLLYVAVSLVVVGMQPYRQLSEAAPLADAFKAVGQTWAASLISIGALAGLTTVVMILMLGMSRVMFAMCRDNLLPSRLAKVHPRFGTPYLITIIMGVVVAFLAGLVPLSTIAELVNIGTLFAFVVVSLAVVILRRTRPDLPRSFRTPLVPLVPVLSVLACLYLMLNLPVETWVRFLVWMVIGVVIYLAYGYRHSRLSERVLRS